MHAQAHLPLTHPMPQLSGFLFQELMAGWALPKSLMVTRASLCGLVLGEAVTAMFLTGAPAVIAETAAIFVGRPGTHQGAAWLIWEMGQVP